MLDQLITIQAETNCKLFPMVHSIINGQFFSGGELTEDNPQKALQLPLQKSVDSVDLIDIPGIH